MDDSSNCTSIHIPIIACLCEALLMSIIINIYFICTKKHRELGQHIYNVVNAACCCNSAHTEQSDEQTSEQPEDDIQYSAVDFRKKREDAQNQTEEKEETIYSGLASLGVE